MVWKTRSQEFPTCCRELREPRAKVGAAARCSHRRFDRRKGCGRIWALALAQGEWRREARHENPNKEPMKLMKSGIGDPEAGATEQRRVGRRVGVGQGGQTRMRAANLTRINAAATRFCPDKPASARINFFAPLLRSKATGSRQAGQRFRSQKGNARGFLQEKVRVITHFFAIFHDFTHRSGPSFRDFTHFYG